ncbi:hypothetical protein FNV62_34805 [Streptomyces sp. RLB3-17]|nr:hypothetical protein FNV67_37090 [Streptomyces sp. S1D4-20]QDN70203.1 hypothetical protein FNV66_35945 [Streptomyces sp. S1D4-14]QDO00815.1 hypothetical protein FNV58_36930 [Streptomyces sp. RLB1-9]QDO22545.1 hypothetical protein FNV65_35510 [Streptomyces sp. S1A1-8]QDO32672.1 hypothetical protein FNV63_35530 [Streptomyces sp. S1A1-3]QDO42604.1 hypothetical protein FNV62_34805 [Streptomyces sp. RLB3-17]QDO52656.1 hypothetical protein FNV60_34430 [Streptomyces sp. RLB3-5]QDO62899.1 hypothe
MAVLFGSPVVRVHVPSPPKASCADLVAGSPVTRTQAPPGLAAHRAVASGPVPARRVSGGGQPNPKPSHSISDRPGYRAVRDVTVS